MALESQGNDSEIKSEAIKKTSTYKPYKLPFIIAPKKEVKHSATVIVLHGLGDSGRGFADHDNIGTYLPKKYPFVKWVFLTSSYIPITCNGKQACTGWYDIISLVDRSKNTYEGKDKSFEYVSGIIEQEHSEHNIPYSRILLLGFSQGAAMSVYTSLRFHKCLGGVVCLCGYNLDFGLHKEKSITDKATNLHILLCHSKFDPIVQLKYGEILRDYLCKDMKFQHALWKATDVKGHTIDENIWTWVDEFIGKRFSV
ncbi:phospholipase [Reticulomyxa filosa]|uniref:Phospholipase n=1 Tax=Reticulomyxa filosa TaxID=46433 RepID=X6MIT7_RETFI|nr:phospholipase [Reticulomyxa filosa]|eukprot:ETO12970.1 phospholipase [Reticulomyxa filosa]